MTFDRTKCDRPVKCLVSVCFLTALIVGLYFFPMVWYTGSAPGEKAIWLAEKEDALGKTYKAIPVDAAAERVLVADRLVNGELSGTNGRSVRVFSAKRYNEKQNEIGLFVHTPDRCWTENGWRIEPTAPDYLEISVHGVMLKLERRIFLGGGARELVYFGGLVGGQPLPYRLDHNLSVGMKVALRSANATAGSKFRASDGLLWKRVWESFTSRRPLLGPKQFVRVSTQIQGDNVDEADALLRETLEQWLQPVDYRQELNQWNSNPKTEKVKI